MSDDLPTPEDMAIEPDVVAAEDERPDLRLGCTCQCCNHAEGSDCACSCHRFGKCAGFEVDDDSVEVL